MAKTEKRRKAARIPREIERAVRAAEDKKATDLVLLDLRKAVGFTDFFVICSGTSEPHLKAIAGEVHDRLKKDHDVKPMAVDGFPTSQWIVADYSDVVVHIFHSEKRQFYSLEDLWGDAPRLRVASASPGSWMPTRRSSSG